jgi:predicted lipid carrier protein YhbT
MSRTYIPGAPPGPRARAGRAARAARRHALALRTAIARFVAARTDRELARPPLAQLLLASLPLTLRAQFRPEYAVDFDGNDLDAMILVMILRDGGRRGDAFEIELQRRRCRVRRRRDGGRRPDATMTLSLPDLVRMATAATDIHLLTAERRITVTGDTFLMARFPGMFRQPTEGLI